MSKSLHFLLGALFFLSAIHLSGQTVYVDATASGANDGTSWENAYTSLQDALGNVTEGQSIWIAAGDYKPGAAGDAEETTFLIGTAINVYGGFAGTESAIDERDVATNVTTLNGDLNGDDTAGDYEANKADNV